MKTCGWYPAVTSARLIASSTGARDSRSAKLAETKAVGIAALNRVLIRGLGRLGNVAALEVLEDHHGDVVELRLADDKVVDRGQQPARDFFGGEVAQVRQR